MSKVFFVTYDLTKDSDHQSFKEKLVKELGYQKKSLFMNFQQQF